MSMELVERVLAASDAIGEDAFVLIDLAYHADEDGVVERSGTDIARRWGLTPRSVWAALQRLTRRPEVTLIKGHRGGRRPNIYRIEARSLPLTTDLDVDWSEFDCTLSREGD